MRNNHGMGYCTQPANGIRKGTKHRPQYTGPQTSLIRAEIQRVLEGDIEKTLNVMDGLIRVLQQNDLVIVPSADTHEAAPGQAWLTVKLPF